MNKPTNFAELVRYLALNPQLECHMPGANVVGHGNAGPFLLGDPNAKLPEGRTFVKKSGKDLIFLKPDGSKTRYQVDKASDLKLFDDRFELPSWVNNTDPIKYFYK